MPSDDMDAVGQVCNPNYLNWFGSVVKGNGSTVDQPTFWRTINGCDAAEIDWFRFQGRDDLVGAGAHRAACVH